MAFGVEEGRGEGRAKRRQHAGVKSGGKIAPMGPMGPNGPRGATKRPKREIKEGIRGNPFP